MRQPIQILEQQRLALQAELDGQKTQAERNRLGQFATPTALAEEVHFLDPAIGTGSFYSALAKVFPAKRIAEALGFEVDPHYGVPAANFWNDAGLVIELADFTHAKASPRQS